MPAMTNYPRVDPDHPPIPAIRELLRAAFTAEDLRRFCQDQPALRASLYTFGPNASLEDMIDGIIDYCRTMMLWEQLLDGLARHNPRQYSRFAAQLGKLEAIEADSSIRPTPAPGWLPPPFTPERVYDDVEIHVNPEADGLYPVYMETSLAGASRDSLAMPWTPEELPQLLNRLQQGLIDHDALLGMGAALFEALFSPSVREHFLEAWSKADRGLRLRLSFEAPELQILPWELLYDRQARGFLALAERVLLSRYLSIPREIPPLGADLPLRILAVTASPGDYPPLDMHGDAAVLQSGLLPLTERGMVVLSTVHHAQIWPLRDALQQYRPHVLHFVGHSSAGSDGSALIFENEVGMSAPLSGAMLGTLLKRTDVRLVVINASPTALAGMEEAEPFGEPRSALLGIGPALVSAGLGAVVISQFTLSDTAAQAFAQHFYGSVARFEPVDEAVARARRRLALEAGSGSRDWAAPALFMRVPDGVLFLGPEAR
jgi:hypothetical protein